jgi:competence protein ComEC
MDAGLNYYGDVRDGIITLFSREWNMFWQAIAFLLGDLIFQQGSSIPSVWVLCLLPFFWLAVTRLSIPGPTLLAWLFSGYCLGLGYAHLQVRNGLDENCLGETITARGVIAGLPMRDGLRTRFDLRIDQTAPKRCLRAGKPITVRVNWYEADQKPVPGQQWLIPLKFRKTRNFYNPGGVDYEAAMLDQGMRYSAYVRDEPKRVDEAGEVGLDTLRWSIARAITASLPDSSYAGIIRALVVGDRSGIPPEQWQTLRHSGTLHLMAISGLHIGLLAGIGFSLGSVLWRLVPRAALYVTAPRVGAMTALAFAFPYAALAGFSLPTQRALVMLAVAMMALILRRRVAPGSLIALAVFVVLLLDPFAVTQAGFWLSFVAVALLMLTLDRQRSGSRLSRWGRAQWVLFIGLLPLSMLFFQGATLIAPLANLIAIPWTGIAVLPPALLGTLLQSIGIQSGAQLLELSAHNLGLIWPLLEFLQQLSFSWVSLSAPGPVLFIMAGIGILLMLAPTGWPGRALGGIWLLPMLLLPPPRPEHGAMWLDMLDVGEGLATIIRTRHHSLIFDSGPEFSPRFDTGSAVILPFLRQNSIDHIDMMIISHGDNDHIGGAHSLMEAVPVSRILSSVPEKLGHDAETCRAGQHWQWDGVQFSVLHPPSNWSFTGNDRSCVLRVANMSHSILLTGDIEAITELRLRKENAEDIAAEFLFVPHHGSSTSSTPDFISAVSPRYALVSTGYHNRFGFPHPDIVARYGNEKIPILNTAESGAVHMALPEGRQAPVISRFLDSHPRNWYTGLPGNP